MRISKVNNDRISRPVYPSSAFLVAELRSVIWDHKSVYRHFFGFFFFFFCFINPPRFFAVQPSQVAEINFLHLQI